MRKRSHFPLESTPLGQTKHLQKRPTNPCLPCCDGGSYSFVGDGMILKITYSFTALDAVSDLQALM